MQVTESAAISSFKTLIAEEFNIPAECQRLVFKGKTLAGMRHSSIALDYFILWPFELCGHRMLFIKCVPRFSHQRSTDSKDLSLLFYLYYLVVQMETLTKFYFLR